MEPYLFVSYGMTKCGSTLAFQLVRVALIQAGLPQPVVTPGAPATRRINFMPVLTPHRARRLLREVDRIGHPLVIKTHSPAEAPVQRLLAKGRVRAHAVYRDLRDMALSMVDHGVRARAAGRPAFSEIETLADARRSIDNQLDKLGTWLAAPSVQQMAYDRLAFATEAAAADILDHLGLDGDPKRIARHVLTREFIQKNKAVRDRYVTEMSAADSAVFRSAYAPFYEHLIDNPGRPLPPGARLKAEATEARP